MAKLQPEMKSDTLPVACFAPPLSDERLARYRELVASYPGPAEVKDALQTCLACVAAWWELPESKASSRDRRLAIRHRGKDVEVPITPLEGQYVQKLWDVTPWLSELDRLSNPVDKGLFDALPAGELRDCAFHLLWHCKELTLDREPLSQDKLPV